MDEDKRESKKKEELENRKEFEDENENEKNENEYEEVDWDDVIEEEKSSEELLKEYNESLMKLTRIENKVRGMNRFARTLERGKEEYRIRDVVFKTYEELYYKLKKDVLKEVQEYNHIVSGWKMESKEMEKLGAEPLPGYLNEDVCGVSKKVLEAAEREKNRVEGKRWGEAVFGREGLKEHSDSESEDDVSSQRSSLESLRPIVLGGEKKQVIRVEKLFVIDVKTMAKLTNDKGEFQLGPYKFSHLTLILKDTSTRIL